MQQDAAVAYFAALSRSEDSLAALAEDMRVVREENDALRKAVHTLESDAIRLAAQKEEQKVRHHSWR